MERDTEDFRPLVVSQQQYRDLIDIHHSIGKDMGDIVVDAVTNFLEAYWNTGNGSERSALQEVAEMEKVKGPFTYVGAPVSYADYENLRKLGDATDRSLDDILRLAVSIEIKKYQ